MDLIEKFCDHHHAYNGISPARRVAQRRVLRELEESAGVPWAELTAEKLRVHLAELVDRPLAPTTIGQRLTMIRPFVEWLWRERVIDGDALMELRTVPAPRGATTNGKPRPYSRKELAAFWRELEVAYPPYRPIYGDTPPRPGESIERAERYLKRWRDGNSNWNRVQAYFEWAQIEAIVALALYGGLRREEIFLLDVEAMHHENAYVAVTSARKNPDAEARNRAVPWMGTSMRPAVERWLTLRDELAPPHDRPWLSLFRQHRLTPMRFRKFEMLLHDVGRGWEFHRMRHTFGTEALRAGMELERLSKIMGHSRIQQTLHYAELVETDVVRSATRVGPSFERAVGRAPVAA